MKHHSVVLVTLALLAGSSTAGAGEPPLLRPEVARALASEVSGESAKRNLESLVGNHRMRGSRGFRAAADHIAAQLRAYGLPQVDVISLPADGTQFYGTQKARPAWDAELAELWELDGEGRPRVRLASWESMPLDARAGQRERRRHRGPGRRRRGDARGGLRRQGRAREDRAGGGSALRGREARGRSARRLGHRELRAEPAHGLVGREREPRALGAPRLVPEDADVRVHGHAEAGAPSGRTAWRAASGFRCARSSRRAVTRARTTS